MRIFMIIYVVLVMFITPSLGQSSKPNILLIVVDDLRPELGCYDVNHIITPNIDKLGKAGVVFKNAYTNVAVCGASRASLLTGMRPIPKQRFVGWNARADVQATGVTTLPQYFKEQGYYTVSNGKVFHEQFDSPQSWSEPAWRSHDNPGAGHHFYNRTEEWVNPESEMLAGEIGGEDEGVYAKKRKGPFYEAADVSDDGYHDGQLCNKTIEDLKHLAKKEEPFLLACGFWRPHLPFNAPKKYWDLYDANEIELAENRFHPKDAPKSLKSSAEIKRQYTLTKGYPGDEEFHRVARHAYYACVSYIDAQVGKLLNTLDELGLSENTIVVLWGDHGFHLGEHNFWGKHNTKNLSVRIPLIIRTPSIKQSKLEHIVESIDIFPTLCELADLPIPSHCDGLSLKNITIEPKKSHKPAIYTTFGNALAIRTKDFLYTEWGSNAHTRMLFDHRTDPQENVNVAEFPDYKETVERLSKLLQAHRSALNMSNY